MAEEIRMHCEKGCGKPFKRLGKWYANHIAKCDGTPWEEGSRTDRPPRPSAKKPNALDGTIRDLERRLVEMGRDLERAESTVILLKGHCGTIEAVIKSLKEAKVE